MAHLRGAGWEGDLAELRATLIGRPRREVGRVILVCGLPGAGKTTLAMRLADELDAIQLGGDERDAMRERAAELGAAVESRVLVEPVDELWRRIVRRQLEGRWGARPIRRDELERWAELIEYPDDAELALFDEPQA